MLQDEYLEAIAEAFTERITQLNLKMLKTIGDNIKRVGELNPSSINVLKEIQRAGGDADLIEREIARVSEESRTFVSKLIATAAEESYGDTQEFFDGRGLKNIPYKDNKYIKSVVKGMQKTAADGLNNMANTTVIKILDRHNKPVTLPFKEAYAEIIDRAATGLTLGYSTFDKEMKDLLKTCGQSGLRVEYESGRTRRLDTAVRMNMLEATRQVQQQVREEQGELFGADGYEITAHQKCAPDHEDIQGKQFTKEEYEKLNKRLKRPIGKMGCRHRAYPVIIGISKPAYSEEELKEFKKNNHTEVNFEGKKMTKYEAIELQGKLETDMRYTADTLELATASGNEMLIAETKNRAQWIARKYNQLSKAADLPMRKDRVSSIDPKTDRFIQKVLNSSDVELTNDKNSSIMKLENDREVEGIDLHYIGKLDKKVYGSISKDIITDEVIITNERIQHIKDGHPNDYERYCKYLNEIIKKPDYIIEANKPNTALVLKAFKDGEEQFKTVLRIITSTDNKNFKNSIITFMKIDEKEWKRLIKNKKILYKPE